MNQNLNYNSIFMATNHREYPTLSNVSYLLVAIHATITYWSILYWWMPVTWVIVSLVLLTIASGGFHWTEDNPLVSADRQWFWQKADEVSMYFVSLSVIAWMIFLLPNVASSISVGVRLAGFAVAASAYMAFVHESFQSFKTIPLLAGLILVIHSLEFGTRTLIPAGFLLIGTLAAALGRTAFKQYSHILHSAWHILTAVALDFIIIDTIQQFINLFI